MTPDSRLARRREGSRAIALLVVATVIALAELYRRFGPHPHLGRRSVELTHEVVDPWAAAIADELLPPHRADELAADTALVGVLVGDRIWRRRHRPA